MALVAIDPRNGELRAVAGGREFLPGGFNRAVAAHRQAGSAFKPFVYLAALEAGLTPATVVDDEPVEVEESGKLWQPANAGDEYLGPVTLRRALARSANAATVRVSQAVGPASVVQVARRMGISSPLKAVPSVALGSFEVTPLELAAAYAPFANGGFAVQPSFVLRIEDRRGKVLWEAEPTDPVRAIDPRDAFLLNSMLQSAVDEGTGSAVRARGVNVQMGGKTGTTNDNRDAWFVGFTPTLVAAVWVGDDARRPLGGRAWGASLAAPIWADFYRTGWEDREEGDGWSAPRGLVQVTIDAETGLLAGRFCPLTRVEWFREGTEPDRECDEHREGMFVFLEDVGKKIGKVFSDIFD
jgi:penicillin-binding protein 1A